MKSLFGRRWHRIPVALVSVLLALVLIAGGAFAAYRVFTSTPEITVLEALEVTEIQKPGWFWNWGTPEVPPVQQEIYPGMDIGAEGWGGKYFIHNLSSQPVQVTITVSESSGQTDWYGLRGCYASTDYSGHDTCNYAEPIVDLDTGEPCWTNPGEFHSCTFDIGSIDYVWYVGMPGSEIQPDSNCAKFFVEAKVASDADPAIPLSFTITVDRG